MTEDLFSGCHSLPVGTCLHGAYEIRETIGAGGFAVTYRGIRKDTGGVVAIKEYFPPSLAVRNTQEGLYVLRPYPEKNTVLFQKGLRRFINEAGILKSFQHLESIVPVYDMFEENGTAYLVMEYIDGMTLAMYVAENGTLTFPEISQLIVPVIRSLARVHAQGLIHRDISPDNLIIGMDNRLYLIDFGAAGSKSAGDRQNTVIIKAGYAPPEQYIANGRTGAWTDIYAICATIYFSVTGHAPAEAVHRLDDGLRQPLPHLKQLLPWQYAILEKGLQLRPSERFQSAIELCEALTGSEEQEGNATILVKHGARHDTRAASGAIFRRFGFHAIFRRSGPVRGHRGRLPVLVFTIAAVGALMVFLFRIPGLFGEQFPGDKNAGENIAGKDAASSVSTTSVSASSVSTASVSAVTISGTGITARENAAVAPDAKTLIMPDLKGKTLKKAKKKIRALDRSIRIDVDYTYDQTVEAGRVVRQSIIKGVYFMRNQIPSLSLTVSKGKKPSAPAATPKPEGQTGKTPRYKVKGDDGFVSIPLE